jgi:ribosomal-protein-alanine N-acetyltransferase
MLEINFHPFKNLETERLLLRRIDANDVEEIKILRGNPEIMKFIPRPLIMNNEQALEYINLLDEKLENNEAINWAITIKGNPKHIGNIGIFNIQPENYRCEIGYMIQPEFHGKGIVPEAIKAVLDYSFDEVQFNSIEAVIDSNNIASERVLQKNNFVKEAHFLEKEYSERKERFVDIVIYTILKRNFKQ